MKRIVKLLSILTFIVMLLFFNACGKNEIEGINENDGRKLQETLTETDNVSQEMETENDSSNENEDSGQRELSAESESITEEENDGEQIVLEESEDEAMEAATLLYQGHASIRITTAEGKVIYVDPFMGSGYDLPADLILITHGHYDHTQTDLIKTQNTDCVTITQTEALKDGTHQTFDLGYVKVEAVEAGYNKNHDVKSCVGYILTFSNGATLYLSGDTSKTKDMENFAERELDYAFFCCDGVYNMDMSEAIECAKLVGAKHSIPYHMVPANGNDGFDQTVAESFDVENRIILAPGDELTLE